MIASCDTGGGYVARFLGLDSSTQSLSAVLIDTDEGAVVAEHAVSYDEKLPAYGTENGVLGSPDPTIAHSPPLMWVEAVDVLLSEMRDSGVDFSGVAAVSGSGQQHGSVYLNAGAEEVLASLDPDEDLAGQMGGIFSRETSPIWMDSSTSVQCDAMNEALGGREAMARATGSVAFERFTGPQIRKFYEEWGIAYGETDTIHLVSSFLASVFSGRHAPIDRGDGAGMNLMDISRDSWHAACLEAAAPGLVGKLPPIVPSDTVIGEISRYFTRYGFSRDALSVVWSGDNPNSLIGTGLVEAGRIAISLGTSDTYFGYMPELHVDPAGEGHVFGAPCAGFMSLICFKNGSLARERVRDAYVYSWDDFSRALESTLPGNGGRIMLPYFDPEIVPRVLEAGVRRYRLDENDADGNCRAVVEAQMLSMKLHSRWMGVEPEIIYATGGASANRQILRVMADVHNAAVYRFESGQSAALGAALRAAHAFHRHAGEEEPWDEIVKGFAEPVEGSRIEPDPDAACVYEEMADLYEACEGHALNGEEDPTPELERWGRSTEG
jgi:xylulokinase